MKSPSGKAGKWLLRVVLLLLLPVAIDVAILAFPAPLFAHRQEFDEFTIYAQHPITDRYDQTIAETRTRIAAMENARPGARCRIFLCDSEKLYALFAFLTRRTANSLAIGMSWLGNVYVNQTKVQRFAAANHLGIRHCRFEGNLAEVIAHEVVHFNLVKSLGYRRALRLPVWKSEGYAEYQANLAVTRVDIAYDFSERIELWLDEQAWGGKDSFARRLFGWHLLVEFLAEVKVMGLEDLTQEAVTEASARRELLAWYTTRNQ